METGGKGGDEDAERGARRQRAEKKVENGTEGKGATATTSEVLAGEEEKWEGKKGKRGERKIPIRTEAQLSHRRLKGTTGPAHRSPGTGFGNEKGTEKHLLVW